MQVRDVMTRGVVTVGPDTSAKYAAEVMAEHGYAALPVVDGADQLVGIVAEADVLRDRLPADPRLHLRRDDPGGSAPPLLVRGVMTQGVRTVDEGADVSDVARLFVDDRLRSVPVLANGRLVGIVSRRDLLHALVRPDPDIARDLARLVEGYTGDLGDWDVAVVEGVATVRRTAGVPEPSAAVEANALRALARTVPGVVGVRVLPSPSGDDGHRGNPVDADATT
ncbi:CBS domain-containing protein [Blastococcus sp. MG754426]|uniref:CBS domain-containing protein n=1 Tax=unclassified Blastococcus TaxID=2619396 RepID=UPI001EF00E9D|nr:MULTISPECIES: CBS domain-containing protein [unclassified Blastococcus]MCF6507293.1 CBS domain-containing protein [Blastococcus sp. MG754426]MCF6510779.1 CBS domain-containing protein [Blastococcus sp. MG754427]